MRAIDAAAVARDGEIALMAAAGGAIASLIPRYAHAGAIVAIAGDGNNGGDAFAALASLDRSFRRIVYEDPERHGSPARMDARRRALESGVELRRFPIDAATLRDAGLLLDGIVGVNARLPLNATMRELARTLNASGAPVLALDVPSGLDPTDGRAEADAVRAVATICLGRPKRGLFFAPALSFAGDVWCASLGMRDEDTADSGDRTELLDDETFAALIPRRSRESEKRSSGAPLIVAGSEQFPGAAVLCALGAARAGAGYVTVAAPANAAAALRAHLIEQVVVTFDEHDPDGALDTILDIAKRSSSIAIGPGLPLADAMGSIVRGVIERADLPIVADASAFFHLTKRLDLVKDKRIVLTPHANEFARLSGKGTVKPEERYARLRAFVEEHDVTTLLKGEITLIADRDTTHINTTGTSALASAGTGDVLSGIIATLLAQGLSPIDAARAGAYWHGRAGRIAGERRPVGVIARDVYEALAEASVVAPHPEPIRILG